MENATWQLPPGDGQQARALAEELGLSRTTASVLVRRGYADPPLARAFLEGAVPGHDPFRLADMAEAVAAIRGAVYRGDRICVHGDYDADHIVALATVADVVPLVDENRALARAGLRRLAQTQKPGLRALMRVAGVDPAACDEGAIGFRLAPRINASGRLGRPEAALELLLTDD